MKNLFDLKQFKKATNQTFKDSKKVNCGVIYNKDTTIFYSAYIMLEINNEILFSDNGIKFRQHLLNFPELSEEKNKTALKFLNEERNNGIQGNVTKWKYNDKSVLLVPQFNKTVLCEPYYIEMFKDLETVVFHGKIEEYPTPFKIETEYYRAFIAPLRYNANTNELQGYEEYNTTMKYN